MNQFKKDLNRELRSESLSQEKRQLIAEKAKARLASKKRHINWQYRIVLATFTFISLGFGYLLWQQDDSASKTQGAARMEPVTSTNWSVFNNDLLKVILLLSFFIVLSTVIKRRLQKSGKGLPVCVKCGEEWSYKKALKQSMKNGAVTCPYCGQKQYRTKKSFFKGGLLNFFMPFIVVVAQLFDSVLLGFIVYFFCVAYMFISLSPYYLDLQEKDHSNEPLW